MKRALKLAQVLNPLQVIEDGQQALDYLAGTGRYANREEFPLPGLVLLDLRMPFVPGFEVLRWMRQQPALQCVPVIVFTSSKEDRDMQRAYALGANSFLVKSNDSGELTAMVKALATYWLHYNVVPASCAETVS
jgi:CheY-like chemotaxis protein